MANNLIIQRLEGILSALSSAHLGGASGSSATKGRERESFVNQFLTSFIPPAFRVSTGDITDSKGSVSGQLDLVLEYGFSISFPAMPGDNPRVFFVEGVGAVIEVKSDLTRQWDEIISTSNKVFALKRKILSSLSFGQSPGQTVPIYAVGYDGWGEISTYHGKLNSSNLEGILCINRKYYVSRNATVTGAGCLLSFVNDVNNNCASIMNIQINFRSYVT